MQRVHKAALYITSDGTPTATHVSATRRLSPSLGLTGTGVPGRENCGKMDRQGRPSPLASSFTGRHTSGLFQRGYVKSTDYQSPDAILTVYATMLHRVCKELEYRLDVSSDTKVAHTEVCYDTLKGLRV